MSQHKINVEIDTLPCVIQMGWDKPLQRFYCVISPLILTGELDDPLYSNLYEENPDELSLDFFIGVCENYGVMLPVTLINEIKSDCSNDVVNREMLWNN